MSEKPKFTTNLNEKLKNRKQRVEVVDDSHNGEI